MSDFDELLSAESGTPTIDDAFWQTVEDRLRHQAMGLSDQETDMAETEPTTTQPVETPPTPRWKTPRFLILATSTLALVIGALVAGTWGIVAGLGGLVLGFFVPRRAILARLVAWLNATDEEKP